MGDLTLAIFMAMSVLFGIVGNAVVVFIFSYETTLRKVCNIFVIHLAMIDIIIASYYTVGSSLIIGKGTQNLRANTTLCTVVGIIMCIIFNVSIAALTVIAIHRYISIVRPMENRRIFSARNCFLFCGAVWIYDGLVCLPPVLGWGRVVFKEESQFCFVDRNFNPSYNTFALAFLIIIPSIITIFCYISLYLRVRKSKRQVQVQSEGQNRVQSFRKIDLKMALQMFIIVVFLYATWGPYLCMTLINDPATPRGVSLFITAMVGMNSMINPFVYIYFNTAFRAAFMKIFCPCRKPEIAGVLMENDVSITRNSTVR